MAEHLYGLGIFNRFDARGGYWQEKSDKFGFHVTTRKSTDKFWTPNDTEALRRHFEARHLRDIVGVHAIDPESGTCRWGAGDLDDHDGLDKGENLRRALAMREIASDLGFTLHLFSSDGRGGIHAWIFVDQPVASHRMFALLKRITADSSVETFPRQASIPKDGYGNWIRLFGKHYKRPAWSRLFGERDWLSAEATVDAILRIEPDDASHVPEAQPVQESVHTAKQLHVRHFAESPEALRAWLESHGIAITAVKEMHGGGAKLIVATCPFAKDHGGDFKDTSVIVTWRPSGIGFLCFHNRCSGRRWRDVRRTVDPDYVHDDELYQDWTPCYEFGPDAAAPTPRLRGKAVRQ